MKAKNSEKIILDLCGGTGSWSRPYVQAGYKVYNLTLPKYDLFDIELKDGYIIICCNETLKRECISAADVYGILAAPTCTMFSLARTVAKTERDFATGMKLVKKCLNIIWYCREQYNSKLKFWALENPLGYLRQFLGKPPLTFNPNDYGDNYTKRTDLWGYYNFPKTDFRELTDEEKTRCSINTRPLPPLPDDYILPDGWNGTAAKRSMTSKKFAEAFYKANK